MSFTVTGNPLATKKSNIIFKWNTPGAEIPLSQLYMVLSVTPIDIAISFTLALTLIRQALNDIFALTPDESIINSPPCNHILTPEKYIVNTLNSGNTNFFEIILAKCVFFAHFYVYSIDINPF